MIARVSTVLDASPPAAWEAVKRLDTFRYVTRGVLGYRAPDGTPDDLREGMVVRGRLYFFHVLPAWSHEIRVVRVDEDAREILTSENGGPVKNWGHLILVEPGPQPGRCRYTDEIDIRAGVLTPLVWAYAHVFYRYRQARWRRLARTL
jgi:hypothetical protein